MLRFVTKLGLVLLASAALSAQAANLSRELEPNDDPGSANLITLNDGSIRGQMKGYNDLDFYKFNSPGGLVRFLIGVDSNCNGGDVASNLFAAVVDSTNNVTV